MALKKILINLLSNVMKFTRKNGDIVLAAKLGEDGSLCLSVTDTGIGIKSKHIADMLQPLRQADNTYSRRQEGTGLDLPLALAASCAAVGWR